MQFHATIMERRHTESIDTTKPKTMGSIIVQITSFHITQVPFFSFSFSMFCCLWVHVGSIPTFSRRRAQAPFLFFFTFGCKWVPSPTFNKEGAQAPFFFSFCSFFFVAYGCKQVPSPNFGKGGACSRFFPSFC